MKRRLLSALLLAATAAAGCRSPVDDGAAGREREARYKAAAVLAVTTVTDPPAPAPTPTPGRCDNCNGTGKLGDGRVAVPCPVCGGDGRTDNAAPTVWRWNDAALNAARPARRWQALVVGADDCPACLALEADLRRQLSPLGWLIAPRRALGPFELESDADVLIEHDRAQFAGLGIGEEVKLPLTIVFTEGREVARLVGCLPAAAWSRAVNAAIPPPAEASAAGPIGAIRGGNLAGREAVAQLLHHARELLGPSGSITLQRPGGTLPLGDRAVVTFESQTAIVARYTDGALVVTCAPPPRIKIEGVPIFRPAISGATITADRVTLGLVRWPDVVLELE